MRRITFAVDIDGTITENGGGRIHLGALSCLRHMASMGHNVIFVSGRSSVEGFLLAVFGGTTQIAVGENGGCISTGPSDHILLGDKKKCTAAFELLQSEFDGVKQKPVFPRLTEVVLERTFDVRSAQEFLAKQNIDVVLSDSQFAYHLNSSGIDKATGLHRIIDMLDVPVQDIVAIGDSATDVPMFGIAKTSVALANASDDVKSHASIVTDAASGDGVIEAIDIIMQRLGEKT